MLLTNTINQEDVSSFIHSLKSLSLNAILKVAVLVIVLLLLIKLLTRLFEKLLLRSKIDRSLHGFLRTGIKILLYFVAVIIVAGSLRVDVTSLIAVLSVAGLAVSLAIQGTLSNLAGGIVVLTTKPFHVGDYVDIGGSEGFVEEIGMTYTRLLTYDHLVIFIPNSAVSSSNITNYTLDGKRRVELVIHACYTSPIDCVKAALRTAVDTVGFDPEPEVLIQVSDYGDSAIAYTVRAWCPQEDYWDKHYALLEEIKRSFDAAGVQMSYPHLNVHLDK